MLFNSIEYFIFLAGIVVAYFATPYRWRVWLLLVASYFFYLWWRWEYGFLLLGVTVVNYVCGLLLARTGRERVRKVWLASGIVLSLSPLVFFKYCNFVGDSIMSLLRYSGIDYGIPGLDVILPVGISFYTLQAIGYSIDVFRGKCAAERHFGRFALYVSFFPQLLAGPIGRADPLLSQLRRQNQFDIVRLTEGGKLITWGLFKKVVIADNLVTYVDRVYGSPDLYSGSTLLLATYFFAFQIYCDFSGYSDIAIGSARILGYDLMQNFRLPYLAASVRDFWRRWHISLSSWFADYVYIPLGGNRVSTSRWAFNIISVFLLSGLWHGASWTFVIWGALHGCYYLAEALPGRLSERWGKVRILPEPFGRWVRVCTTFHLVVLAWVFFRASTVSDAFLIVGKVLTDLGGGLYRGPSQLETLVCVCLIVVLLIVQLLQMKGLLVLGNGKPVLPRFVRWSGYLVMVYGLVLLGKGSHEFIYFQF
jgi:alginate O-acetyltransferase complex protein AlgI